VENAIDRRAVGAFQTTLFILCLLTLVIDGLDLQLLSFAAPPILAEWGISEAAFGPAMAAALVGMAIGNGAGGWPADRYGRRPVLIASVLIFGLGTFATAISPDLPVLIALRTLCGLGFGAAVPGVVLLVVEWLPRRLHGPATPSAIAGNFTLTCYVVSRDQTSQT
jgi:AAHS family 4-hydroxybenzoate transporter-like MFS transporter